MPTSSSGCSCPWPDRTLSAPPHLLRRSPEMTEPTSTGPTSTGPMNYERSITVDLPYTEAVERTRAALAEQGFGVLTQIDVQATLREKRGLAMEPYVILGACNPDLASQALDIDRSIGVLLPCNVVVSARDNGSKIQIL